MTYTSFQGAPLLWGSVPTILSGTQRATFDRKLERLAPDSDGRAVKTTAVISKSAPQLEFTTLNIAEVLALMSATGSLPFVAIATLSWFSLKADIHGPVAATGSVHEKRTATSGTMCFAGLSANANELAVMTVMALFTSTDGDTDPVNPAEAAAVADPMTIAGYILGEVTIDGVVCDEVAGVEITPSIEYQVEYGVKPFARINRPRKIDWSLTVRHTRVDLERTTPEKASSISVVFNAVATGGPTSGPATLTFAVAGLLYRAPVTNPATGNTELATVVQGAHDGTNFPASWSMDAG